MIVVILSSFGYTVVGTSVFTEGSYEQAVLFLKIRNLLTFPRYLIGFGGYHLCRLLDAERMNKRTRIVEAMTKPKNTKNCLKT